jgi:hypothetical protein
MIDARRDDNQAAGDKVSDAWLEMPRMIRPMIATQAMTIWRISCVNMIPVPLQDIEMDETNRGTLSKLVGLNRISDRASM